MEFEDESINKESNIKGMDKEPFINKSQRESLEQKYNLCEINVDMPPEKESVRLKPPIVVYREIYKKARDKAKLARRLAIQAFLEAKQIKNTFLAGEVEDSDDDLDTFGELENM